MFILGDMMDVYNIQTLIAQEKLLQIADLDPNQTYLELGVYQEGNRKIGPGNANSYPSYVVTLQDVLSSAGGGGGTWGSITGLLSNQLDLQAALNSKYDASNPAGYITSASLSQVVFTSTIDLNTTSNQPIGILPSGSYTPETAYVFDASTDLTVTSLEQIIVYNSGVTIIPPTVPPTTAGPVFSSKNLLTPCPPPGCIDQVRNSLSTSQMIATLFKAQSCWPPPCNVFVLNGGENLSVQIVTPTGVPATAKIHIILNKIQ